MSLYGGVTAGLLDLSSLVKPVCVKILLGFRVKCFRCRATIMTFMHATSPYTNP